MGIVTAIKQWLTGLLNPVIEIDERDLHDLGFRTVNSLEFTHLKPEDYADEYDGAGRS